MIQREKIDARLFTDVIEGLAQDQKMLPSKYFYDERGSELFELICEQIEYYPTDAEVEIMKTHIGEMVSIFGEGVQLVELGSGSSMKTRLLLEHLKNMAGYVPVDISEEFLLSESEKLRGEYPGLKIDPVAADYTGSFKIPVNPAAKKKVIYFPGSTIGNFTRIEAKAFLKTIASMIAPGDGLLIGVDRKKDKDVLEKAYNDKNGVTAEFNLNLLKRLNRELDADFDLDNFEHNAIYNADEGRVEMHLISQKEQEVRVGDRIFLLQKGETIHTENSYKYTTEEFADLASEEFNLKHTWTDQRNFFNVHYLSLKK
ncbi:MAG: L-histidine N(alpha)-methyltransferase [Balneolaceae bacterium]